MWSHSSLSFWVLKVLLHYWNKNIVWVLKSYDTSYDPPKISSVTQFELHHWKSSCTFLCEEDWNTHTSVQFDTCLLNELNFKKFSVRFC